MKISKNFSYHEIIRSEIGSRLGMDNTPGKQEIINITALVQTCMQPIRDHYNRVVTVTSGYRSKEVNSACGSDNDGRSQHCRGMAIDWEIFGIDNFSLIQEVPKIVPTWDKLISEYYNENIGPDSGWIHLSFNPVGQNRREVLKAVRKNGKTVYEPLDLTENDATKNT